MPPLPHVSLQDSSSGNASDMESQEGGGGQGQKFKGKEGSRQSASHKAAAGYKVEDKTTWTLLQQQQQYFTPPPTVFTTTHFISPPTPPPYFLHFLWLFTCCRLFCCGHFTDRWDEWTVTLFFFFFFAIPVWLPAPPCTWLSNKNILKEQLTCFCFPHFAFWVLEEWKTKIFFPSLLECLKNTSCWSCLVKEKNNNNKKKHFQDKYMDIFGC